MTGLVTIPTTPASIRLHFCLVTLTGGGANVATFPTRSCAPTVVLTVAAPVVGL